MNVLVAAIAALSLSTHTASGAIRSWERHELGPRSETGPLYIKPCRHLSSRTVECRVVLPRFQPFDAPPGTAAGTDRCTWWDRATLPSHGKVHVRSDVRKGIDCA